MARKGRFRPKNVDKYRGDPTKIIYRSSWEQKFMMFCDDHPNVVSWSSEEFFIPYVSPVDKRVHRYYPDFYVKKVGKDGVVSTMVIEIKPLDQTKPPKKPEKLTEAYIARSKTYAVNQAKWKATKKFCDDSDWKFQVITEKELGIVYGRKNTV